MAVTLVQPVLAVEVLRAEGDGCLAHILIDAASAVALAIDPRLDQVDAIVTLAAARGVRIGAVIDTHTHADHLSGARQLAARTGAELLAHARSRLRGPARRVTEGDEIAIGETRVKVIDAPGHTPDSLALVVPGHVFTGDALFVGGAGRTDFMGGSASDLYDTFRKLEALPDATVVHPGHDYAGRPSSTIGEEKCGNPLLRERDRAALEARLAAKAPPPADMSATLRHNLGEAADTTAISPRDLDGLRRGEEPPYLIDVRTQAEFESERIEGARNVPLADLERRMDEVPERARLVAICRTGVRATIAAETLARHGRAAQVLEGGVVAWRRANLPLRLGRRHLALDRQVQLVVGVGVLASTLLGAFVHPAFLGIAGFFGAGLAFAGATGTCGLALLLMKAPWNKRAAAPVTGAVCAAGAARLAPAAATCAAPASPAAPPPRAG